MTGDRDRDADVGSVEELAEFAVEWGLEVSILPTSWYNLGSTVHAVFYPPERYR